MKASEALTPEQRRTGERNLARLLIIAHDHGVPAAIEELRRMRAQKRAKDRSSQAGESSSPASVEAGTECQS